MLFIQTLVFIQHYVKLKGKMFFTTIQKEWYLKYFWTEYYTNECLYVSNLWLMEKLLYATDSKQHSTFHGFFTLFKYYMPFTDWHTMAWRKLVSDVLNYCNLLYYIKVDDVCKMNKIRLEVRNTIRSINYQIITSIKIVGHSEDISKPISNLIAVFNKNLNENGTKVYKHIIPLHSILIVLIK